MHLFSPDQNRPCFAGSGTTGSGGVGFHGTGVFVARFAPDGALDPSFGRAFLADRLGGGRLGSQSDGGVVLGSMKMGGDASNDTATHDDDDDVLSGIEA